MKRIIEFVVTAGIFVLLYTIAFWAAVYIIVWAITGE